MIDVSPNTYTIVALVLMVVCLVATAYYYITTEYVKTDAIVVNIAISVLAPMVWVYAIPTAMAVGVIIVIGRFIVKYKRQYWARKNGELDT